MKKIYITLTVAVIVLFAGPMAEEEALALFEEIRQSEYEWAVQQWEKEMHIKTTSRTSTRRNIWTKVPTAMPNNTASSNEALNVVPPLTAPPVNNAPQNPVDVIVPTVPKI